MTVFRHVSRINVSLWGRRVGTLVPAPQRGAFAFRYERSFLSSGIEIAPLMMPLRAEPYVFADLPRAAYDGLPPIFADSLPDAFGTGLVDHWLQVHGLARDEITPLDRLAYLGRRTMGALTYEPDRGPGGRPTAIDMRNLVESARRVLNGELASATGEDALREIIRLGSSAGGAQAKAVIGWNRRTNAFLIGDRDLPEGFEHWIVKFTPPEHPWRGEAMVMCFAMTSFLSFLDWPRTDGTPVPAHGPGAHCLMRRRGESAHARSRRVRRGGLPPEDALTK